MHHGYLLVFLPFARLHRKINVVAGQTQQSTQRYKIAVGMQSAQEQFALLLLVWPASLLSLLEYSLATT